MLNWAARVFHPVVYLPDEYAVLDLSGGTWTPPQTEYSVGKYDEVRPNLYNTDLFGGTRNIHMGIDIGGPVGTPCMAFADGEVSHFGYNPEQGDYGNVVITKHYIEGASVWALYGHVDAASIEDKSVGQKVSAGEVIAWFGAHHENGGWEPHLHFQLSLVEPETHDLPGVVAPEGRVQALLDYPDPRLVLGPLY
ncbi:MAG: peptidoglycan DD-metalloendopeptidase family protein [Candidatus Thalassarchaeaceae archaeon]|nr:peptidoglycan DD-metalloendopeptidase family protein [Candidatus Thalassarchaeaceae archaeon]MDP6703525.1 peptidoglycan DD-metalloendopeptidase family protein [Candidatus Thalassarchaeaceae archaeon]MDP7004496.1 peptidoglycan DD-metalloendopeptidase family protein [Candidatus Thalassarchaeaceae archaeon]